MRKKSPRPFKGVARKDRCFRVYLNMPDGVLEDDMMDYIEAAVRNYRREEPEIWGNINYLDDASVRVIRFSPKYGGTKLELKLELRTTDKK